ncbi:MAG: biopolymer transporter ExbD [Candidatus Latescibacterota bacterium]|jgi:biopolymer transport protein ExbD
MKPPLVETKQVFARINVTPIIDVALVLVIILLITAPMITALNMDIDLPQAKTRSVEDEVRLSITLSRDGELAVDDELVAPDRLLPVLLEKISESSKKNILVVVRADASITHGTVKQVINDARTAGAKRIAVATRQRGNGTR